MNQEKRHWHSALQYIHCGWDVRIEQHVAPGTPITSDKDVLVYVIDVSTAWIAAGGLTSADMFRAAGDASKPGESERVRNDAPGAIAQYAQRRPTAGTSDALQAITYGVHAITQTGLFLEVQRLRHGKVAGHWFYLVYGLNNGDVLGRPVFWNEQGKQFMPPEDCMTRAAEILRLDHNLTSHVGRLIAQGGGLALAPVFTGKHP